MCENCKARGSGSPPLRPKGEPALHIIRAGKFFEAKKGVIFIALAGSTVVAKRGSTGVYSSGSTGVAHAGSNFTAEAGSFVTAMYGSSGVAQNGSRVIKHYGSEVQVEDGAEVMEVADDERHLPPGHTVTTYAALDQIEKDLIDLAKDSAKKAHCPYSEFPVGAAVWAENAQGERALFWGANRETAAFNGVCAERSAIDDAVEERLRQYLAHRRLLRQKPGRFTLPALPAGHARARHQRHRAQRVQRSRHRCEVHGQAALPSRLRRVPTGRSRKVCIESTCARGRQHSSRPSPAHFISATQINQVGSRQDR